MHAFNNLLTALADAYGNQNALSGLLRRMSINPASLDLSGDMNSAWTNALGEIERSQRFDSLLSIVTNDGRDSIADFIHDYLTEVSVGTARGGPVLKLLPALINRDNEINELVDASEKNIFDKLSSTADDSITGLVVIGRVKDSLDILTKRFHNYDCMTTSYDIRALFESRGILPENGLWKPAEMPVDLQGTADETELRTQFTITMNRKLGRGPLSERCPEGGLLAVNHVQLGHQRNRAKEATAAWLHEWRSRKDQIGDVPVFPVLCLVYEPSADASGLRGLVNDAMSFWSRSGSNSGESDYETIRDDVASELMRSQVTGMMVRIAGSPSDLQTAHFLSWTTKYELFMRLPGPKYDALVTLKKELFGSDEDPRPVLKSDFVQGVAARGIFNE